jgi:LmbE family N-acetylglucosaminyl deacetylase
MHKLGGDPGLAAPKRQENGELSNVVLTPSKAKRSPTSGMSTTLEHYTAALSEPFTLAHDLPELHSLPSDGPVVLIFAPHPDDESITGLLPLVFRRELQARVLCYSVTLGSHPERQHARRVELENACHCLGFEPVWPARKGLHKDLKATDPEEWAAHVTEVADVISSTKAEVLVYPHAKDLHPMHETTHQLVEEAWHRLPADEQPHRALTEFWHPMASPNLMVDCSETNLSLLLRALACHAGEIARNAYHLRLPAWMIDNTRRGAESIGGMGGEAPPFLYSTLYRWLEGSLPGNPLERLSTRMKHQPPR